jgi:hypothetical protein
MDPIIEINGSQIYAVPAVHYRAVFAREVNRICYSEETRPDAVVVELGPHIVCEITAWMKELGLSPFLKGELPCMLGILVKNRLIHPELRETALSLQKHSGKPLSEISRQLQKQLLYFSDKYLLGLSSTDSIIEALRCAVELSIPVYGVDMDEFSVKPGENPMIEEPPASSFNLTKYVSDHAKMASTFRDVYVDRRREHVMAARLKSISRRHKRILFTGGLAHWEMIKGLMKNPEVRPADFLIPEASMEFTRVILHPKMALAFMDIYPVLATMYENNRHGPGIKAGFSFHLPESSHVCRDILSKVYKKYFREFKTDPSAVKKGIESHKIPDFERLVANLQMVHQRFAPSIAELLECSGSMMPSLFSGLLTSQLMDIGRPWASPEQFPELPLIMQIPPENQDGYNNMSVNMYKLIDERKNLKVYGLNGINRHGTFTIKYHQTNPLSESILRLWKWEGEPKEQHEQIKYFNWVWPPCEALLYGSACEAARMVITRSKEPVSAAFEGSLYDGLDIKATIRSTIRGERKIYIKKPSSAKKRYTPDGRNPEPTVFIFEESKSDIIPKWSLMLAGMNLKDHVKNKSLYDEIVRKYGNYFVSVIGRLSFQEAPEHFRHHVDSYSILEGISELGSPCINARQGAEWLEDNNFRACPVLNDTSMGSLVDYYKKYHNMEISESDWKTTLIRFAIPYARERVVVIAPRNFTLSDKISSEARRRNISIDLVPLNYFPTDRIALIRQRIMVRAKDPDGFAYPPEVEKALGQKSDKYFELLPPYMQQQLKNTL